MIFFILIRIPFSCDDRKKILSVFFVSQARNILVVLSLKGNLNKVLIKFRLLGKRVLKLFKVEVEYISSKTASQLARD